MIHTRRVILAASTAAILLASHARAEGPATYTFDQPSQELKITLRQITRTGGLDLYAPGDDLAGRQAPALHGQFTLQQALATVLDHSGLEANIEGRRVFIRPIEAASETEGSEAIIVTGSRIRGAPTTSPVIRLSGQQLREAGQTNLGDAIRTIPQNFGGSQNPGAGVTVPETKGNNLGGSSSIDLRGLGGDATLTLLNGHRLPYDGANQAIDVSTVPLAALDRIEIVADGASAIYGSDAVAGVANVILKRDFSGVRTDARIAGATDGGDQQQQYDIVAGTHWGRGGFLAAYSFTHTTPIRSEDRSYAASVAPGLILLPGETQHSAVITGHQMLGNLADFSVDAIYTDRRTSTGYGLAASLDPALYGVKRLYHARTGSIAPSLTFELGSSWSAKVEGVYGQDKSFYRLDYRLGAPATTVQAGCYCNQVWSGEASMAGSLFSLPGGDARSAFGAGYRSTSYHGYRTIGDGQNINVSQSTYYAFGEVSLPVLHRLTINLAGRYEDYPGIARVATPKVGFVYGVGRAFDIKGSWGRSFKAPSFYQRYSEQDALLDPATQFGGPAGATALFLDGGNPKLKPERATTWSTTLAFHPPSIPSLHAEISYFHVDYTNRIVAPITYPDQALLDSAYARYVVTEPTAAQQAAALAGRVLDNETGAPYDPTTVVAIIDDSNVNATRQRAQGIDGHLDYKLALARGDITFSIDAAYLKSRQQLTADQPITTLAGTIFNPPHLRGRGGASWTDGGVVVAGYLNYTGSVRDVRLGESGRERSMATLDLAGSYRLQSPTGVLHGVDFALSVQNLFNRKPGQIATAAIYETPYDSLNYSPVGRLVSLTIGKSW